MIKRLLMTAIIAASYLTATAQEIADTTYTRNVSSAVVETIVEEIIPAIPPTSNATQLLQGRVSGLFATSTNGRPGSPTLLLVRGQNSIDGNSEPYYIVNGVPATATQLSSLNPEDIQFITVLKDAIATAPYGVNGGNGVIVIETKKGRGPLRITASAETGVSKILKNKFGLMNTRQKLDYERELGIINQATYDKRLPYNYNQIDEIFRTAWLQQYNLQLSGGNDRTTYYLSGGYYTQDGILEKSDFKRYTINANISIEAARWLKMGVNIYMGKEKNTYPLTTETGRNYTETTSNLVFAALHLNPYEQLKNSDGSYNNSLLGYPVNPLYEASLFDDKQSNTNLNGIVSFDVTFFPKLTLKSNITLAQYDSKHDMSKDLDNNYYSAYSVGKETMMQQANKLHFSSYFDRNRKHQIQLSLTEELKITDGENANGSIQFPSSSYSYNYTRGNKCKTLSGMFDLKYSYNDRLHFSAMYRVDRLDLSSIPNTGTAKSWATGLKWIAYEGGSSWINRLSIRGSTGKVGHLPLRLTHLNYTNPLSPNNSSTLLGIGSPYWETTQTHNVGVDLGFFDNRLYLTIESYLKNTSDVHILHTLSPSATSPYSSLKNQAGEVKNKGVELSADWSIFSRRDYRLNISTNLSLNYNKLKSLSGTDEIHNDIQVLKEGKPLGGYYLVRWAGVDPNTGDATWYDSEGNKTANYSNASKEYIEGKSSIPSKYAGLMLNGGYKGISLTAHFYGTWDIYTYNQNLTYIETANGTNVSKLNLTTRAANYWKKPGDITDIPKPKPYGSDYADTRLLHNHSYFRLKSLTLAYDVNRRILRALKIIDGCRIHVSAHNLFTITGYRGFTPEVFGYSDYASYPESRTISWGIRLTFR